MSFTDPNNLIDPQLLGDYATAQYEESNKLISSTILETVNVPGLTEHSSVVEMPQWDALGEMQVLTPGDDLNTEGLDDHFERHPVVRRYKSVLNLDLAGIIAKGDPNEEVARQIATNVNRGLNKAGMATLQGSTAANTDNNITDTGANPAVTDFTALEGVFGDIIDEVMGGRGLWLMRSSIFTAYRNLGLVAAPLPGQEFQDDITAGRNFANITGSILGRNVVVDDELYRAGLTSKTSGDALTYLVGYGALKSAVQKDIMVETERNIGKQADQWAWSVHRSMGVKGMDYSASVAKEGPTDAELRNSANYGLVAESNKFVPVSSIQTNYV